MVAQFDPDAQRPTPPMCAELRELASRSVLPDAEKLYAAADAFDDLFEALELAREVLRVACGESAPYIRQAYDKIDPALAKARGEIS